MRNREGWDLIATVANDDSSSSTITYAEREEKLPTLKIFQRENPMANSTWAQTKINLPLLPSQTSAASACQEAVFV